MMYMPMSMSVSNRLGDCISFDGWLIFYFEYLIKYITDKMWDENWVWLRL